MTELKPCPFCGGKELWEHEKPPHYFQCKKEGCLGQEMSWNETREEAIKAWNTRPTEDALQARIDELEKQVDTLREDNLQLINQISEGEVVMIKPDWKDAPAWARYLCQDMNGVWWWHENRPLIWDYPNAFMPGWCLNIKDGKCGKHERAFSYKQTLEKRPRK